jgi:hypothetical protein
LGGRIFTTAPQYKPEPQALFLADRMSESEGKLLEAMNKLAEKMDSYERRLTSMGSNLSKVQSQVDLSMTSIQMLQKEHVVLLKSFSAMNKSVTSSSTIESGVIGSAPAPPFPGSSLNAPQQTACDTLTQPPVQLLH